MRDRAAPDGNRRVPRRIVLTTTGSFGDLHPYLALGMELRARGHETVVGTAECYREKVEAHGLEFRRVRPDADWTTDPALMKRIMAPRTGTVRVVREILLPNVGATYEDTLAATENADLLVAHVPWAARLVAEKTGIAWVTAALQPLGFFSAYDPSILPLAPGLSKGLRRLGPPFWKPFVATAKRATRSWAKPWDRLRASIDLPPVRAESPIYDSLSPALHLALFSPLLGEKQRDWPPQTKLTGFPWYGEGPDGDLPRELESFLSDGEPPIVFTLGSSAAMVAGRFFRESASAAEILGRRAVLIAGPDERNLFPVDSKRIFCIAYAPFAPLFARAAAVVHAGGIGATGMALRSARPALIVPHAHDQNDNAFRAERLGAVRVLAPAKYRARRVAAELRALLENESYLESAERVAREIAEEDGAKTASDALELLL